MTGRSVVGAAGEVEQKLKQHASEMLECAVDDLELRPGGHGRRSRRARRREVSFAAISGRAHWAAGGPIIGDHSLVFDRMTVDPKRAVALGLPFPQIGVFSFGAAGRRGRGRRGHRQDADRARPGRRCDVGRAINPRAGRRPDRGRLRAGHGLRADRGDGLGRRPARQPVADGLQDPDHRRRCPTTSMRSSSRRTSRTGRSAPRASARSASMPWRRPSPMPSPPRPATRLRAPADDLRAGARALLRRRQRS